MGDARRAQSVEKMAQAISRSLVGNRPSIYLYGSCAMNDFRPGWSDIDILVLTPSPISPEAADSLVSLRQRMLSGEPDNPYYRAFEGGMLSLPAFLTGKPDRVVYWGTSGQRITNRYDFDSFCMTEILDCGVLLCGREVREAMHLPPFSALRGDVARHYDAIRRYGAATGRSIYTFGWLLDISRCIYTLRTGRVIAKTAAGEWAQRESLCPDGEAMELALRVRRDPSLFQDRAVQDRAEELGKAVERYADVLEDELRRTEP